MLWGTPIEETSKKSTYAKAILIFLLIQKIVVNSGALHGVRWMIVTKKVTM